MNPAARRAVPIRQALVPAALTRFPTDAAELAGVVNLVVIATLRTGVPFTRHVMATAVLTVLLILATHVAADQDVLPAGAVTAAADQEVEAAPVAPAVAPTVRATVMLLFPAPRPAVVTAARSKGNTGQLPKPQQLKNAAAEAPPKHLAAECPAMVAETSSIPNIRLAMPPKQQHHVPAAQSTPDKAAAVAKQQKPLCFQRGFSFYQTHTNQNYRLSLKYSLAFLYFPV